MIFENLTLQQFKGQSTSAKFGAANYVTGRNFAGKTAMKEALCWLVLGYIPGYPKTTATVQMLSSGWPMGVSADISGSVPRKLGVKYERKGASIKLVASQTLESEIDDATRCIFDPSLFFGLSDAQRIAFACELIRSDGITAQSIIDAATDCMKSHSNGAALLKRWLGEVVAAGRPINDIIGKSVDWWKAERKIAGGIRERFQQTVEGNSDMRECDAAAVGVHNRAELSASRDLLDKQIDDLVAKIAAASANNASARLADADRRMHNERVAKISALDVELRDSDVAIAARKEAQAKAQADVNAKHSTAALAAHELEQLKKQPPKISDDDLRTDDFFGNADKSKKYIATATLAFVDRPGVGGEWIVEAVDDWRSLKGEMTNTDEAEMQRIYDAEEHVQALNDELGQSKAELSVIVDEIESLLQENYRIRAAIDAANSSKRWLAEHAGDSFTVVDPSDIEGWRSQCDGLRNHRSVIDARFDDLNRMEQHRAGIEQAAKQRDAANADYKAISAVLDALAQKSSELVSGSIGEPLSVANKLAGGILSGELTFEEGEIGMRVGGSFVSGRAFSGTESAIVVAGLTAGLARKSGLRVLIVDEIGRLDPQNATRLLFNLSKLVNDGDIDQYIAIGPLSQAIDDAMRDSFDTGKITRITL